MTDFKNIPDNNEGLDPKLNRAGNKNPFGTGSDYFDSFPEKLMSRLEHLEEIETEAPLLSNIPKYNPFEVPADYFEELPTIIQHKCAASSRTSALEWIKMFFQPNFAIPVLTVIFIAFTGIHYLGNKTEIKTVVAEEISIDEQLQNIDESTLIDAIAASGNESSAEAENESIKDYLLDDNIDESNLNYEL